MTAFLAEMTAQMTRTQDPKERARVLRGRLLRGLDLILDAQVAGNAVKTASLQVLYDRLEADYLAAKKSYAKTPEDLLRCPDCPHLGEGPLYELGGELVICDSPCKKDVQK